MDNFNLASIAQEVDKICDPFLRARGLSYFQFKQVYQDDSFIILANHPKFYYDFFEDSCSELVHSLPFHTRQSSIYYWDELQQASVLTLTKGSIKGYHNMTFLCRRKNFYDCTTFAMAEPHPTPFSYYLNLLKELQKFVEIFPILARGLIDKTPRKPIKILAPTQNIKRKWFFLPKRSSRLYIGSGAKDYVTTYEALCVQLLQEGKSSLPYDFLKERFRRHMA